MVPVTTEPTPSCMLLSPLLNAAKACAQEVIVPRHVIITSPPQPSPGDYTQQAPGLQPKDQEATAVSPWRGTAQHNETFRDEYGFRYDAQGHRIDTQGRHISPKTTTP